MFSFARTEDRLLSWDSHFSHAISHCSSYPALPQCKARIFARCTRRRNSVGPSVPSPHYMRSFNCRGLSSLALPAESPTAKEFRNIESQGCMHSPPRCPLRRSSSSVPWPGHLLAVKDPIARRQPITPPPVLRVYPSESHSLYLNIYLHIVTHAGILSIYLSVVDDL